MEDWIFWEGGVRCRVVDGVKRDSVDVLRRSLRMELICAWNEVGAGGAEGEADEVDDAGDSEVRVPGWLELLLLVLLNLVWMDQASPGGGGMAEVGLFLGMRDSGIERGKKKFKV